MIPIELYTVICGFINCCATFKTWRLISKIHYNSAVDFPGAAASFANSFYEIYKRFPEIELDYEGIIARNHIPHRVLLKWLRLGKFTRPKNVIHCSSIDWRFVEAKWPRYLEQCLCYNKNYAEFLDIVIKRHGESTAFHNLSWNPYLTAKFYFDHPSEYWYLRCVCQIFNPNDMPRIVGDPKFYSNLHRCYQMTRSMDLETISKYPNFPWNNRVVHIKRITAETTKQISIDKHWSKYKGYYKYKGELAIECWGDFDCTEMSRRVHITTIMQNWEKFSWNVDMILLNPSVYNRTF